MEEEPRVMKFPRPPHEEKSEWSMIIVALVAAASAGALIFSAIGLVIMVSVANHVWWNDSSASSPVVFCNQACLPGEILISAGDCVECINAFTGGLSSITLSNTLACSGLGDECLVTKGSGQNLTIAALAAGGLISMSRSGGVVTVTATLPTGTLPLCGSCTPLMTLRLAASGTCYECYTPDTVTAACEAGGVCIVADGTGPALSFNGLVAGEGMQIFNNGSGTVLTSPETSLACSTGDVCPVVGGAGPALTVSGYVAGNGITIANTPGGTVFSTPEPVTAGDFVRLPRAGTTYEMSVPWIYENNITMANFSGGSVTLQQLLTRTWWDTTAGDIPPVFVNPVPHNNEYNNTINVELFVVLSITFDGTGQLLATGNMSGLWIPTAVGMEGYPGDFFTYQFGSNACSPSTNVGSYPLATIAMSSLGFSFLTAPMNSPAGTATYACYLRGVSLYRNGTRPTFNPYDGRFPYA